MVRKRCERCGVVQAVPEVQSRCHEHVFGPASARCSGTLVPTMAIQTKAAPPRPQEMARRALSRLHKRRDEVVRQLATLAKRLRAMGLQEARLAKKAAMTDEEVVADRARRRAAHAKGRARRRRRAMDVGGGEVP